MKVSLKFLIIFLTTVLTANSHAFPELPFCPAGGPPGWINYFNDKRDQNIWRQHSRYPSPAYGRPAYNSPVYRYEPGFRSNYNYSPVPYNSNQGQSN